MTLVSLDMRKKDCAIFVINDYPTEFAGTLEWELSDFSGKVINKQSRPVRVASTTAQREVTLNYSKLLLGQSMENVYLVARLVQGQVVVSLSTQLLIPDREASLMKADIETKISVQQEEATITLKSNTFARYVYVEVDNAQGPISDNYFDMEPGKEYKLTCPVLPNVDPLVHVRSLVDVTSKGTRKDDKRIRAAIRGTKPHPLFHFAYKFLVK
jgi:beta-mannosidase